MSVRSAEMPALLSFCYVFPQMMNEQEQRRFMWFSFVSYCLHTGWHSTDEQRWLAAGYVPLSTLLLFQLLRPGWKHVTQPDKYQHHFTEYVLSACL